jgi:hypothetical protein
MPTTELLNYGPLRDTDQIQFFRITPIGTLRCEVPSLKPKKNDFDLPQRRFRPEASLSGVILSNRI